MSKNFWIFTLFLFLLPAAQGQESTYAERLGWGPDGKVVIFHVDDVGMSHGSNLGAIKAMEEGVATSCSIMMPCPWVSEYAHYLKSHPELDAGLHLTLTSEWKAYRWGPLAGKPQVTGLTDPEGCLWPSVAAVVAHATPDEIEKEIRAQIDRAETLGLPIGHLDSHMGTLFMSPEFTERYVKVSIEKKIPAFVPGGHLQYLRQEFPEISEPMKACARRLWDAGLPVVDDAIAATYDWKGEDKVEKYIQTLRGMKPGILEIILHCTVLTEDYAAISGDGPTRKGDLAAMLDPRVKKTLEEEHIQISNWRELKARRDKAGR